MSGELIDWALETLVWTGALMAMVLVARRPVARWFGPPAAYALWLLPLARLALPPLVLPARLAPQPETAIAPIALSQPSAASLQFAAPVHDAMPAAGAVPTHWFLPPEALVDGVIAFWLIGALILAVWRWHSYRAMRRALLEDAMPMGTYGSIRLVETGAVDAPVAFGIYDRVIAMPPEFMASTDVKGRDLAIAHEIAHHRGGDLIANVIAQPLLALHWFNPLAWAAWKAMRRDQEAACDARVADCLDRDGRAHYAAVIAAVARERNMALAAPMAGLREYGPRLGEKAIVHRLRSLNLMPSRRRRRIGGLLVGASALVALPLTASVSYAEPEMSVDEEFLETVDVPASDAEQRDPIDDPAVPTIAGEEGRDGHAHAAQVHPEGDRAMVLDEVRMARDKRAMMRAQRELELAEREIGNARGTTDRAEREAEREMRRAEREMQRAEREMRRAEPMRTGTASYIAPPAPPRAPGAVKVPAAPKAPTLHEVVSPDGTSRVLTIRYQGDGHAYVQKLTIDSSCKVGSRASSRSRHGDVRVCTAPPDVGPIVIGALTAAREAVASAPGLDAADRAEALADIDREIVEAWAEASAS